MLDQLMEYICQCCCGFRTHKRSKLNDAVHALEGLAEDEVDKIVRFFNRSKCG